MAKHTSNEGPGSRYVAISYDQFNRAMTEIGFVREDQPGFWEMSWVRDVISRNGVAYPYRVRIDSTIDIRTGWTRDCGDDAIRLHLFDTVLPDRNGKPGRPVPKVGARAFRTKNAISTTVQRARELFEHVIRGVTCPKCRALMVERHSRAPGGKSFYGCTHYAPNNPYHCNGTREMRDVEQGQQKRNA